MIERVFLALLAGVFATVVIAGCGDDADDENPGPDGDSDTDSDGDSDGDSDSDSDDGSDGARVDFGDAIAVGQTLDEGDIEVQVMDPDETYTLLTYRWQRDVNSFEITLRSGTNWSFANTYDSAVVDGASNAAYMIYRNVLEAAPDEVAYDAPGCDWFPDTVCSTHCCAAHDRCFKANSCTAGSWIPGVGSDACKACNSEAASCVSFYGPTGCQFGTPPACEAWPCGCTRYQCFDAVTNREYCAPACLDPGTLPPAGSLDSWPLAEEVAPPVISDVQPTEGAIGTTVGFTGENLGGTDSVVRFNGVRGAVTMGDDITMVAEVPVGATTGPITVSTSAGTVVGPTFTVR